MNRVKKASWWAVVLAGGLMLALPAAAQKKPAGDCRGTCMSKASTEVESCAKACPVPSNDPSSREAAGKCMNRCAEKFRAAEASCAKTCPAPKKEDQTH
ncbi:hypothetical protein [Archangium violaceum]|uniref:Uncharacterized protein n=1 Tax=Archangium violaceum Cb vi76 TaxID=1406225 RepID=A0A084SJ18_9BACT|nr:hypothetical protein [Archangium violaceum]KFA88453.1 hypothetical protein Q664_41260 [Archangium violaceum Cb vi76]